MQRRNGIPMVFILALPYKHTVMHTREEIINTPQVRKLTICNKSFRRVSRYRSDRYVAFPVISLSGKWLQEQGFKSGQVIDITCEAGKLVITIAREQRFELD